MCFIPDWHIPFLRTPEKKNWLGKGETVSTLKDGDSLKTALGSLVYIRERSVCYFNPVIRFNLKYFQEPVEVETLVLIA